MKFKTICLIVITLKLTSCALFGSDSSSKYKHSKPTIPKPPLQAVPGGTGSNWRYLGTSNDGQLVIEINDNSIKSTALQTYSFEDRKTIINPSTFTSYTKNQLHYKYILSSWQMDCGKQQYIIESATLYNETALQIKRYNYQNNSNVRWIKFGSGSIAQLQYNYICLNENRTLGY